MSKKITGFCLLPLFLVLQLITIAPVFIFLLAANIYVLLREFWDAKQEHREAHPFKNWYHTYIDRGDWAMQVALLVLPMVFWVAIAFPELEFLD